MKTIPKLPANQRGIALVIALVLLLVMTLLGLSSLRNTQLEERMSAGLLDRSMIFQSAETALRVGEGLLAGNTPPTFPASGCTAGTGLCATPDAANPDRWLDPTFTGWRTVTTAQVDLGALGAQPQFIVENMGTAPSWPLCDREVPVHPRCLAPRYRVTARSGDPNRARVILQSNYATP